MEYEIRGDNLQTLICKIGIGEKIYAEAGKMFYKTPNVAMKSEAEGKTIQDKVIGALKRTVTGESIFNTYFWVEEGKGEVAFASSYPGKISSLNLGPNEIFLAQRDAFLCAETSVKFDIAFQKKLGVGFFGGEGFILEKFTGPGLLFLHAGGDSVVFDLQPGQMLQVDTGCLVAFSQSVDYDIQMLSDIKTAIFGGEGLFLTTLTGPGKVILQSLTLSRLRRELRGGFMKGGGEEATGLKTVLGGLGTILGRND